MYSNFSFSPLTRSFASTFSCLQAQILDFPLRNSAHFRPLVYLFGHCFWAGMIHLRPLISSACLFFKALAAFVADTKQTTRNEKGLPYLHIWGIWQCSLIVFFLLSVPESTAQSYCKERPPSTNKKRELYLAHWVSTCTCVHVQHYPLQSRFFLFAASARWQTLMPLEAKSISQRCSP